MELEEVVEIAEGAGELNPGPLESWQVLAWVQSNAPSLDKFAGRSGASGPYVPGPGVAVAALLWVSGVTGSLIHPTSFSPHFLTLTPKLQGGGQLSRTQKGRIRHPGNLCRVRDCLLSLRPLISLGPPSFASCLVPSSSFPAEFLGWESQVGVGPGGCVRGWRGKRQGLLPHHSPHEAGSGGGVGGRMRGLIRRFLILPGWLLMSL